MVGRVLASVLAGLVAALAGSVGALAAGPSDPGSSGDLRVDQPSMRHLGTVSAGEQVTWHVGTWVEDRDTARLDLQLRTWGDLVHHDEGLWVEVDVCEGAGDTRGECDVPLVARAPLREVATRESSDTWHVTSLSSDEPVTVRVRLFLPDGADAVDELGGWVAVGLFAEDESVPGDDPGDELPRTGVQLATLIALAVVLSVVGGLLRSRRGVAR